MRLTKEKINYWMDWIARIIEDDPSTEKGLIPLYERFERELAAMADNDNAKQRISHRAKQLKHCKAA